MGISYSFGWVVVDISPIQGGTVETICPGVYFPDLMQLFPAATLTPLPQEGKNRQNPRSVATMLFLRSGDQGRRAASTGAFHMSPALTLVNGLVLFIFSFVLLSGKSLHIV